MSIKQFRVHFNNSWEHLPSVFATQALKGKVILELEKEKLLTGLEIHCSGKGRVEWRERREDENSSNGISNGVSGGENKKRNKSTTSRTSSISSNNTNNGGVGATTTTSQSIIISHDETYIDEHIPLLQTKIGDEDIKLESGLHEYYFEFRIPSSAPSSFQGPYGSVMYFITVTLSRPHNKKPHKIRMPFTVNGVLDLNKDPHGANSRIPPLDTFTSDLRKYSKGTKNFFNCFICLAAKTKRSPLRSGIGAGSSSTGFHLKLHKTLYVPGEYIQFVADMRNMSGIDMTGVTLSILQETNYYVGDKCKSGLKQTMATAKGPFISSGQTEIWETNPVDSLFLQIPAVPPTNLASSSMIEVKYFLQLEMEFYGQKNIKGQVPILIGTVPLKKDFKELRSVKKKVEDELISDDDEIEKPFGTQIGYPDLPSPTFEEAVFCTPNLDFAALSLKKSISENSQKENGFSYKSNNNSNIQSVSSSSDDSDEEFCKRFDYNFKSYEDKYVPYYAKYTTSYAYDD